MGTYRDLTTKGIPTRTAADLVGVPRATATREPPIPVRGPAAIPANRPDEAERARTLEVVNGPRFVDLPPIQIYAQLLDEGVYPCSISTMYRVPAANRQVKERRRPDRHPPRAVPELVATGPGQVFSRDITKPPGPIKGKYFDAYVMIDIYSRHIVGAHGSAVLAVQMMREIHGIHGVPQVVHAGRGTSMTGKTVAALLSDLEVTKSRSRPRASNDNTHSAAWFTTLKFVPCSPNASAHRPTHGPSWPVSYTTTTIFIAIPGSDSTHDYKRHGTTTLFAASDVLTGEVTGRCFDRHRHDEFLKFLKVIDAEVPQRQAIHVILDNYSTHKHADVQRWPAGTSGSTCTSS